MVDTSSSRISRLPWGATAALAGVALFIATIVALHLLQHDYDPTHQLMSELALGPHGWAMKLAFGGLALAVFGVQAEIGALGAVPALRLLLVAAALCFLAAGIFPLGGNSEIHIVAIATAFVLSVLAMYLFPSCARRASFAAPRVVSWLTAAGVAVSVALGHSILPMGIGQRLAASLILLWLGIVGWRLSRK